MGLDHEELTAGVIGAAIEVHKALGPGFLESVYENALVLELAARGIRFARQLAVPILYRGSEVGLHRLDLLVAALIVVELKAVKAIENVHFAVVRSYLRATGREHGLILNFAKPTLEIKRVITSQRPYHDFLASRVPLRPPFLLGTRGCGRAFARHARRDTKAREVPPMHEMTQSAPAARQRRRLLLSTLAGVAAALTLGVVTPVAASSKTPPSASAKKPDKTKGKKADKNADKKSGKKTDKKSGKKSAQPAPKHHHSEQHVVAMKGNLPNVQSLGALVIDLDTGQELFARRPDNPRAIASLSKLAATLTVMDKAPDLEGLTTIKKLDADVARGGARSRLLEGLTLSNRDLLHAALLGSDNRAVSALGRAVGLGTSQFTAAMNRKVATLGLRFTRFREPTGLSADNQSTPRETIAMLKTAMAHPVLGPILRKPEYDAHPVSKPPIHYVNTHRPAARTNVQILGGKTGYNDSARYCLVNAARIGERNYGMAFLGTEGDHTRFGDVARVADWIVTHKPKRGPSTAPQGPPPPEAILGPSPDGGQSDAK